MAPLILFTTALLVRVAMGAVFPGPAYPDSYYYVHVAQQVAAGHGLWVDYIWNLGDIGARPILGTLPVPANGYWMPLAELVQVPFIWLLGQGWIASGLPFWIVGALAAPLTYGIGRDAGFERWPSAAASLLVAVPGGLTPFFSQPDNFGLYVTLGALSLWLCAKGMQGDRRAFVLGGLVVGLATLARSDGVLLGLPIGLVALHDLLRRERARVGLTVAVGCVLAFIVVVGPWLYRQVAVFGTLAPFTGGSALWLTNYQQLFSIANPPTPAGWLAQGLLPLLASRIGGLAAALGLFALLPLVVVLVPFAVAGAWVHRSDQAFRPFLIYGLALFAASGLLFPVLVPHGTFLHSAAALLPHTFLLTVAGIGSVVTWAGRRRPTWNVHRATAVFAAGAIAAAVAGALVQASTTTAQWSTTRDVETQLVAALPDAPGDVVMSADPGGIWYLSGHPGIVTLADPLPTVEQAMRALDVRWLLLERDDIVPTFTPLLTGEVRPAWLSAPVAVVGGAGAAGADAAANSPPRGALFAVCLAAGDARCSP